MVEVFQVQRENLAYEWNDVALLADQRAYTIVCKTLLQISQQEINEIQEVVFLDWTWQSPSICNQNMETDLVPFHGTVTLQIYYLNHELQQESMYVAIPLEGAWEEALTQQNSMRLVFYHTKAIENHLLLETVLQISRNQPLKHTQVLIGQFQLEEQLVLEAPWPSCDALLATAVVLQLNHWELDAGLLQIDGEYHLTGIYQNARQPGEQVFVYENRLPMTASILVPEGLQELNGVMPYYQSITAQVLDEQHILMMGSGVFCTLPVPKEDAVSRAQTEAVPFDTPVQQETIPTVVNSRGSRRATLSKYMRNLNNSVETPSSIRNIELHTDTD